MSTADQPTAYSASAKTKGEGWFAYPAAFRTLAITPLERQDMALARAVVRAGGAVAVDIGRKTSAWPELFSQLEKLQSPCLGVCIPDHVNITPNQLPFPVGFVILHVDTEIPMWAEHASVIVQVTSVDQAQMALIAGATALISKGQESGGPVGEESSFILLQRILALVEGRNIPVWCQGGIGLHSAAGAIAGGAFGVVIDAQLALMHESQLSNEIKSIFRDMDGSETTIVGGYRIYSRPEPSGDVKTALTAELVRSRLDSEHPNQLLPIGQDAALARLLATLYPNVEALLHGLRVSISGHIHQAKTLQPFQSDSPLARVHGTRYPIAQGPMTRVSDSAGFAAAVAENGALPFLALSLMSAGKCRRLMAETRALLGERSWGVGILGFADADILEPQLELIREFRPKVVLLAGGRSTQARGLQDMGIITYLHVPSPGLLELFLQEGMRHFVLEGRECGGHVGPRFSFMLWEQQLHILLNCGHVDELHILFAGGIHDARSAAMVSALAAPLVAMGAKIGVLMGTAYVTTREAVERGAISQVFQQTLIAGSQTVLIETAPGHAVRCLPSNFVQQFNAEKKRQLALGLSQQVVWKKLETLNIGRLRIATKGVERRGAQVIRIDAKQQADQGLYMIGQAIALRDKVIDIAELHRAVSVDAMANLQRIIVLEIPRESSAHPVAIIGMECIFPGSPDLEAYWANILAGRDLITETPPERWNKAHYYREGAAQNGRTPSKWGGFIDAALFDPLEFGIPPHSMAAIEPVQLLSLMVAKRALADAGYGEQQRKFNNEKTAVIVGAEAGTDLANAYAFRNLFAQYCGDMPAELDASLPDLTEDSFPGVLVNVIAGRIANRLGLGGVNYAVDSACASSLTAIDLAVKELRAGSSDMVLAIGADFHNSINDFLMFASAGALSPSGRCRSFDSSADGICLGEGVGVVVLKRLDDAQRDGDRIYAVIDGVAGSSDGKGLGLTAPRKEGQKRALDRAYRQAGVLPVEIELVEAHGTGTVVGDKTELQTLTEIFISGGALPGQTGLGSVKSQIGHTKCAAGMAGLIKIAKSLHHRVLPPTALIETPNLGYCAATSPFALNKSARPWLCTQPSTRAAVSAFGFGGANFHAVLSAYRDNAPIVGASHWNAELFVFRGADFFEAKRAMTQIANYLHESDAALRLRDLSCTAAKIGSGAVQCAFVANDCDELVYKIQASLSRVADANIFYREPLQTGKIAFLYPGQGSQSPNMLRELFITFPQLHSLLEMDPHCARILFPATAYSDDEIQAQQRAITDTRNAQPALGIVEMAANWFLQKLGIEPAMAAGHSYGELVALSSAGVFDAAALLQLSRRRGEIILAAAGADPGKMAAVNADYAQLKQVLVDFPAVAIANHNSHKQTVISGPAADIDAALTRLKMQGLGAKAIETACAFHSPVVAKAEGLFRAALETIDFNPPAFPVYANTTTQIYPEESEAIKAQLATHVVSPVRFAEQIERMYADGARHFVEVGPKRVLSGFLKDILGDKPHRAIAFEPAGQTGIAAILTAAAQLAVVSDRFDTDILFSGRSVRSLDLEAAQKIPGTAWLVDGGCAWPHGGAKPAHARQSAIEPRAHPIPSAAVSKPADIVITGYLDNMREVVRAQRDVLLAMLGQTPIVADSGVMQSPASRAPDIVEATPLEISATATSTVLDARAVLLQIVSERTGYPVDMLNLGLDLEADLSIDSIKRVEIIGALNTRLKLGAHFAVSDELLEKLSRLKTLQGILDVLNPVFAAPALIAENSCAEQIPADVSTSGTSADDDDAAEDIPLSRFVIDVVESPDVIVSSRDIFGKLFILTDDGIGIARALAARLRARGANVHLINFAEDQPLPPLEQVDGLIHLWALHARHRVRDVKRFFNLVRETLLHKARYVLVASGLGGDFGESAANCKSVFDFGHGAGLAGMIKSIDKEWPEVRAHWVDLDSNEAPDRLASYLELELLAENQLTEVGYRNGRRRHREFVQSELPQSDFSQMDLNADSVVLLTGGARGITARLAIELAQRFRCRVELVGRTALPSGSESEATASALDLPALRQVLIASGENQAPGKVEKRCAKILAEREMRATIEAIKRAGAQVNYTQLDMRDIASFTGHIQNLYARYDRIDGVVHGAGIIEDTLMRDKSVDSFERVFDTKVRGALMLNKLLRDDVKFVVFFSSVASAFGNRGQVDYAAANDVLDKLATSLQSRVSGRVLSVNWGPWAEAGMVSPHRKHEYARNGIGLIPVREGIMALLNELASKRNDGSQVVLMCGRPECFGNTSGIRVKPRQSA